MPASKRFSAVYVLLMSSLCLSCLLVNSAAEQAGSTDRVTEGMKEGMKEGVTEGVTRGVTEGVKDGVTEGGLAEGVTKGVTARVADKFPNPWQYPEQCRRPDTERSWICDVDGVLSKEQADSIDSLLVSINTNASCVCNCSGNATIELADEDDKGYIVGVAVVTSLGEDDLSAANRTYHLERFGDSVRQDWFSNRTCDDSALIIAHYMYNCSKIYISLADALGRLLPSQSLASIYDAVQPSLDKGNIGPAIATTVKKLSAEIEQAIITPTDAPPPDNLVWGILGVVTISSILLFHYWIKY